MPQTSSPRTPTEQLKQAAQALGFQLTGVAPAVTPTGFHRLLEWIERGYAGEMRYLEERYEAYRHPQSILDGVRSILMLGMNYHTTSLPAVAPGEGKIARYAWGTADYHDLIHGRLKQLRQRAEEILPAHEFRGVVDTAPMPEREFAQLAGLGWIGKNTLLLHRQLGSYFFLAAFLTTADLDVDEPFAGHHCGTCTACLDACPTQAFPQPYVMDARRCISYLTIEHRSAIPDDLQGRWDDWLFGCDVCQEVCPWNRHAPVSQETSFFPRQPSTNLCDLFFWDDDQFRQHLRKTPLWRSKRRGILRNAALLLGSQRYTDAEPALQRGLQDTEELVRESCQWALKQLANSPTSEGERG